MSRNLSQKSNSDSKITIEEEDLFVYWLNKIWPSKNIDFEQFKIALLKTGKLELKNSNNFIAF